MSGIRWNMKEIALLTTLLKVLIKNLVAKPVIITYKKSQASRVRSPFGIAMQARHDPASGRDPGSVK